MRSTPSCPSPRLPYCCNWGRFHRTRNNLRQRISTYFLVRGEAQTSWHGTSLGYVISIEKPSDEPRDERSGSAPAGFSTAFHFHSTIVPFYVCAEYNRLGLYRESN